MSPKFESKLQKFISDNIDLVAEYESIESAIPLEYCGDDIIYLFQNISKLNKSVDFNVVLKNALKSSIKSKLIFSIIY